MLTRVVVDEHDPAFSAPSKFIGPSIRKARHGAWPSEHSWTVKRDGSDWRRVVASPSPGGSSQLHAIQRLVDAGFLVVCAGGGGIPVVEDDGRQRGVEAVIDKDLTSALLASELGVETLVLATDVDGRLRRLRHPASSGRSRVRRRRAFGRTSSPPARWGRKSRRCAASLSAPAVARVIGSLERSTTCSAGGPGPRCCRTARAQL